LRVWDPRKPGKYIIDLLVSFVGPYSN